jgi:hypothetical protein
MTEISKSVSGNSAANFLSATRRSRVALAALAGLAVLASSIHGAFPASLVAEVRNIDDPGRIPYESQQSIAAGEDTAIFPVVPAGHRLVIQHVVGFAVFSSAISGVTATVFSREGLSTFLPPSFQNATRFDQLVQLYVDAGNGPRVSLDADAPVYGGAVTLTGYLLDCTAAPCATIAH